MTAAQLERLQEHLQRLRLFKSRARLEALLQEATSKELSYTDFLDQVLTEEVASKTAKHVTMRTQLARFPKTYSHRLPSISCGLMVVGC
jgi:DNA replication protein DnaC